MSASSSDVFEAVPSLRRAQALMIDVRSTVPDDATATGIPVSITGAVPPELAGGRDALAAAGFRGEVGDALALPGADRPLTVAVGVGDHGGLEAAALRHAAVAFGSAARHHGRIAMRLPANADLPSDVAAAALVEGIILTRYAYDALKSDPGRGGELERVTVVVPDAEIDAVARGAREGAVLASATQLARDLANAPPGHMTATHIADLAVALASERALEVKVFDESDLVALECGGLLGVNAGSAQPPRMVRLSYVPRTAAGEPTEPSGRLTLVGKGVMYDSGGISLKPSDAVHATMKTDMSGAGAVLAAMSALSELGCPAAVTAYLMCAENMPSGTAVRLGDVLTIHGGKSVEVINTDAEGRLIMADALVIAAEEGADAIIDIATLTGACMRALGSEVAGVFANHPSLVTQLRAAADRTDEPLWELPLDAHYRKQLDSDVADLRNLGSGTVSEPGAITAALFLAEFVDGTPWAHVDIAGTAQNNVARSWRPPGATGFGARLLIETARNFAPPG